MWALSTSTSSLAWTTLYGVLGALLLLLRERQCRRRGDGERLLLSLWRRGDGEHLLRLAM